MALRRASDRASTAVLRIVCGLGLTNAILFATIALVSRSSPLTTAATGAWAAAWWLMLARADDLRRVFVCRPTVLVAVAAAGMAPVGFGGVEGLLGTQALWLTWVAAVTLSASWTLTAGVAMTLAVVAALLASGMSPQDVLRGADRFQAILLICNPLLVTGIGLAIVGVFRGVLAGAAYGLSAIRAGTPASTPAMTALLRGGEPATAEPASGPSPLPAGPVLRAGGWKLTPAEQEVVEMLRAGLTVQQIALQRNGSELTVRTHVKRAKRKVGARTLSELITLTWPVS